MYPQLNKDFYRVTQFPARDHFFLDTYRSLHQESISLPGLLHHKFGLSCDRGLR